MIIQEVLREANEKVFGFKSLQLKLLKECPEMIPHIAQWQYNDWHSYDTTLTLERLIKSFEKQLTTVDFPFTIVVLQGGMPIGSISLKKEGEPEFSDISDKGPWVGSFHVIPRERHRGIGPKLYKVALTIAKRMGYEQVNFYTSNFSNVVRYVKKGAQVVETRPFRGHTVTLMKIVSEE
jgi:GNAT superfamily N-acetyltransferase